MGSYAFYYSSIPIHLENFFKKDDPNIVVIITTMSAIVLMKSILGPFIWRHKANAITPLTIPEYQQIFSYFEFNGNVFFIK